MISSFFKDVKTGGQFVGLLLMLLIGLTISSGILVLCGISGHEAERPIMALLLQGIGQVLMFMIPAVLFALFFYGNPARYLCVERSSLTSGMWLRALSAMAIMLLCIPLSECLAHWNESWHLPQELSSVEEGLRHAGDLSRGLVEMFLSQTSAVSLLLNLIIIAALPACCEELFFRGCMQQLFTRWLRNPHWAIVIAALVFSLMHGEFFALVPRFFLGIVLGYLFWTSGSLLVSIAAHFANNAATVILYYLYNTGHLTLDPGALPQLPLWATLFSLAVAVALLCLTIPKRQNNKSA